MNIIIVGGGKVGSYLATLLGNRGYNVRIVESRKAVAQRLEEKLPEGSVVRGMGSSPDVLEEAGVLQADVIIAVTGDDEVNLVVAMLAKMEYGVNRVVARVNNPANAWMFDESMGVDIAVDQADIITKSVEEGLDMEDVFTIMRLGKDGHEIVQGEIRPRSAMVGKSIAELQIPDGLVFVALEHEGNILIPNGAMTSTPGALGITMERRYRKRVGMRRRSAMTKPSGAKRHYDMPLPAKQQRGRQAFGGPARAAGIGPNKACGHKGGIRRQGSKRG